MELGPLWATWWLDVEADVPEAWAGAQVDLLCVTNSEATLWLDGEPAQGLVSGAGRDRVGGDARCRGGRRRGVAGAGGDRLQRAVRLGRAEPVVAAAGADPAGVPARALRDRALRPGRTPAVTDEIKKLGPVVDQPGH